VAERDRIVTTQKRMLLAQQQIQSERSDRRPDHT